MIKELIKRRKLTQVSLAERVGVTPSSVNQWITGRSRIDQAHLLKVASVLEVEVADLLAGILPPLAGTISPPVPLANLVASVPFLLAEGSYPVLVTLLDERYEHVVVEVDDEGMSPDLRPGARLLARQIDPADYAYETGGVYTVRYRGRLTIRRIRTNELKQQGTLTLIADNPQYGTLTLELGDIEGLWRVLCTIYQPVR